MTIYRKNLEMLSARFPDLAEEFPQEFKGPEKLQYIESSSGKPSALIGSSYVHSKYDPGKEADRLSGAESGNKQNPCFIIEGCGLGYLTEKICCKYPESPVIIVEPETQILIDAVGIRDFSKILEHPLLVILAGGKASGINAVLPSFREYDFSVHKNSAITSVYREYFDELDGHIRKYISRRNVNNNTLRKFGKLWARNLCANYAGGRICAGIEIFRNCLCDFPALVLAAGPSLDLRKKEITELSRSCAVICVDSALNFCRSAGIKPDFIVTVDPQYYNSRHLDYGFDDEIILVAESSTSARSVRRHRGPVVTGASFFPLGRYFDKSLGIAEKLGAGGSVATAAWDFARYCGCRTIYICGLDLGYINNQTHYRESHFEKTLAAVSTRINTEETFNFRIINSAGKTGIADYKGKTTVSDKRLNVYRWWFENQAEICRDVKTFVLDPGSTKIEGFEVYNGRKESAGSRAGLGKILENIIKKDSVSPAEKKPEIDMFRAGIEFLYEKSSKAIRLLNSLETASREKYSNILKELDKIDNGILSGEYNEIISFLIQDQINEVRHDENGNDAIRKSMKLYKAVRDSSAVYLEYLYRYFLKK